MRRRFTLDANSGLLVDRDGEPLGRVVSLTLDTSPWGGGGGNSGSSLSGDLKEETAQKEGGAGETKRPTATQLEREAIDRIWSYWLQVSGKKQQLDDKRRRIIRSALQLVGEDATKLALLGLTRSPHHQGQNEQRKKYMEIRYALKGLGDESDDERIEKAITWAAQYAPNAPAMDDSRIQRYLEDIRYTLSLPHRPERERAEEGYRKLKAAGFTIVQLNAAPWARLGR